ncbi:hypothetical protein Tco_0806363 [Tanacetum coccineum]
MCDVPFCDNSAPLDVLNDHFEIFSDFNDDCTLSDDDSFEDIDYVEASPPDSELVSLEEVKDDILREKLLNIYLLIDLESNLDDTPLLIACSSLIPPFLSPLRIVTLSLRSKREQNGSLALKAKKESSDKVAPNSDSEDVVLRYGR